MAESKNDFVPQNLFVNSLLTDLYQITMAYAYFQNGTHNQNSVFDLFFRKCPFKGEFCVFAGLDECLRFVSNFKFNKTQIQQLTTKYPKWEPKFWEYLSTLNCSEVTIYAQREGSVVFPRVPLLRLEGPLGVCQLLETTLLNLVNYPSLLSTNAARIRLAVGDQAKLLEFGLRRAQGPDGAMSASRYAFLGGFDGTSNVLAGLTFDIPISGTHAHSFVSSFTSLSQLKFMNPQLHGKKNVSFIERVQFFRKELKGEFTNEGELAAFIAYANAYPETFLALVDTYDTLNSGVINFLAVSLALNECKLKPIGIRLDSGDLAYLSRECRKKFKQVSKQFNVEFDKLTIVASNDINEEVLHSLKSEGHEINAFGIGTHLVTCKRQPALGCVYKLVEIEGKPRIKVSQVMEKMTIPSKKMAYRLYGQNNTPLLDLMHSETSDAIDFKQKIRCHHPYEFTKRCDIAPTRCEPLLHKVWDNGTLVYKIKTLKEIRAFCLEQVSLFREDYKRYVNPTPYKVSVTQELRKSIEALWEQEVPVKSFS